MLSDRGKQQGKGSDVRQHYLQIHPDGRGLRAVDSRSCVQAETVVGIMGFVGGPGALELYQHQETKDLLDNLKTSQKKIAAICIAPVMLARSGILNGKKSTVYRTDESIEELQKGGAEILDQPVVTDGSIVTANGPQAATAFGQAIIKLLND